MKNEDALTRDLMDAGCSELSAAIVQKLLRAGRVTDALHELRVIRCDLMDELHRSQRRVDRLDTLIRQTEKERKTSAERRQET